MKRIRSSNRTDGGRPSGFGDQGIGLCLRRPGYCDVPPNLYVRFKRWDTEI